MSISAARSAAMASIAFVIAPLLQIVRLCEIP
jgi:hypothetical protein